ncbi:hypothetical protein [Neorhizobium tomejilense]|uniref:hypothetical protein n=1 Tax=Neorhizobium tomejilense TaxID=2093828 RepID=UPI003ECC7F0E
MTNLFAWIAILAALYWFMPSFRRMVNGWIVQLGDKVKHDADLPHKPEPITEQQVEDAAGLMFRMDFPNNPDIEKGFDGTPAGVKEAYMGRARAYLSGEDMDEYAEKIRRAAARIDDASIDPTDDNTPPRQRGFG